MKVFPFLLFLCGLYPALHAQTSPETAAPGPVIEMFDLQRPPSFPGGEQALMNYLATNLKYTEQARKDHARGIAVLSFVVEEDGSITGVNTVRPIHPDLDREAIRVVSGMPAWTPGEAEGKPVRVRFTLPIRFVPPH
jgi:TonB family protein